MSVPYLLIELQLVHDSRFLQLKDIGSIPFEDTIAMLLQESRVNALDLWIFQVFNQVKPSKLQSFEHGDHAG